MSPAPCHSVLSGVFFVLHVADLTMELTEEAQCSLTELVRKMIRRVEKPHDYTLERSFTTQYTLLYNHVTKHRHRIIYKIFFT